MATPIQRQSLGQQQGKVSIAPTARNTTNTAISTNFEAGQGNAILSSLLNAAGTVSKTVQMNHKKKIESDKIKQLNLALRNQAPSDDASQAGYVAHSLVDLDNKVLANTSDNEELAKTFTGSDEDWDELQGQNLEKIQAEMLEAYPEIVDTDAQAEFLETITNSFMEQAPRLTLAREHGKLDQEHKKRIDSFTDSVLLRSEGLKGEALTASMNNMLTHTKGAMQLSEKETEQAFITAALNAAKLGDGRLLDYTDEFHGTHSTSLMARTGALQTARALLDSKTKTQTEGFQAQARVDLEHEYDTGQINWEQLTTRGDELNKLAKKPIVTATQMIAMRNKRQKKVTKQTDLNTGIHAFMGSIMEGADTAGMNYSNKDQQPIIEGALAAMNEQSDLMLQRMPNGGTPEAQAKAKKQVIQNLAQHMSASQFVYTKWKDKFAILENFNVGNSDIGQELPPNVVDIIDLSRVISKGSLIAHTNPKTLAVLRGMEAFERQGKTQIQALELSQNASRYAKPISGDFLKDVTAASDDVADEISDGSWLPNDSASEKYAERFRDIMLDMTKMNIKSGYTNADQAAEDAGAAFEQYYTRTEKGHLLYGDKNTLSKQMGVNAGDIDLTLETYMQMHKTELEDQSRDGDITEAYYDVIPNRGIVVIRDGANGMRLTDPIPLQDLKVGRDSYINANRIQLEAGQRENMGADIGQIWNEGRPPAKDDKLTNLKQDYKGVSKPITAEREPEQREQFEAAMMAVENGGKSGYDKGTGAWTTYMDSGGTPKPAIAYGHRLTEKETAKGYIEMDGQRYSYKEGESQITNDIAKKILQRDLETASSRLSKKWKGYDALTPQYKKVLMNLEYNTGSVSNKTWKKLTAAMKANDNAKVRAEMITSFSNQKGDVFALKDRATRIADALEL